MPNPTSAIYDLSRRALDALVARWPGDAEPLPERQYVSNGTVIWDGCESLAVMVQSTFTTNEGDLSSEAFIVQGMGMVIRAAIIGVAIIRCVPDMDEEGNPPPETEIEASAEEILKDAMGAFNALEAAQLAGDLAPCSGLVFERWTTEGPQGGLAGGVLQLRALLL